MLIVAKKHKRPIVPASSMQFPLFGTAMSSHDNGSYSVEHSYSKWGESTAGWRMFDGSATSSWYPESQFSAFVTITCNVPQGLKKVMLFHDVSGGSHMGYWAAYLTILGSNNGSDWVNVLVSDRIFSTLVSGGLYRSNEIPTVDSTPYKYFRVSAAPFNHPYVAVISLVLSSDDSPITW